MLCEGRVVIASAAAVPAGRMGKNLSTLERFMDGLRTWQVTKWYKVSQPISSPRFWSARLFTNPAAPQRPGTQL